MKGFFTSLGKGFIYFLTPFIWVVCIAVAIIVSVIIFIGYIFYSLVLFFTGRTLFGDLEEDIKAKEIIEAQQNPAPVEPQPAMQPQQQIYMQSPTLNVYPNVQQAPINPTQPVIQESYTEPLIEETNNLTIEESETVEEINDVESETVKEIEEEIVQDLENIDLSNDIKEYVPRGGDVSDNDYMEDLDE